MSQKPQPELERIGGKFSREFGVSDHAITPIRCHTVLRYRSALPINDPITGTALPKLVARRFQPKVWSQLIDRERCSGQGICGTSFEMFIDRGSLV